MRPTANPAPKTDSAREALRAFYCELCDRGYSRISEYEAHLSSYTHTHKKNFKEMKASQKDTSSSATESRRERERIREEKEMQRLMGATGNPPPTMSTSTGIKSISLTPKPGFKNVTNTPASGWKTVGAAPPKKSDAELSWGNNGEDDYDPAYPTPV